MARFHGFAWLHMESSTREGVAHGGSGHVDTVGVRGSKPLPRTISGVDPKRAAGELLTCPPLGRRRAITKIRYTRLALQRTCHRSLAISFCLLFVRLRDNGHDVAGSSVDLSSRDNNPDTAEIGCLLQFGQCACLSPTKARPEITQPTKQIVGALLVDGFFVERLDLFTFAKLLNCTWRPPDSRQVDIGQKTVVVRVDVYRRSCRCP